MKNALGEYFCHGCAQRIQSQAASPTSTQQPSAPTPIGVSAALTASNSSPDVESPDCLQPGELDCFYDAPILSLLRRQIDPDELLMLCDVRRPKSRLERTMLLASNRLIFVGVTNQADQKMIVDRREITLGDIDNISVNQVKSAAFGRSGFQIQIASRDGIESWVTTYSSGPRIVAAVQALKCGDIVKPFIRTTGDLAKASAALPTQVAARGPGFRLPAWFERGIFPFLRTSHNRALHGLVVIAGSLAFSVSVVLLFLGVVLLCFGDTKLFALIAWLLIIGVTLGAVSLPNALFSQEQLKIMRSGNAPAQSPPRSRPTVKILRVRRTLPWVVLASIFIPVAVLGSLSWWGYTYYQSAMHPPLPRITVTGMAANAVTFSNWNVEVIRLSGIVQFNGATGVELHYRITESGVLRDSGVINPPIGGALIIFARADGSEHYATIPAGHRILR